MPIVTCPACGEDDDLRGERIDERIVLTCGRCGNRWDRDTTPRCRLCGSEDLQAVPTSTLEEAGRGDQRTPTGIRIVHVCWDCGGRDVTSGKPIPGPTSGPSS